MKEIAIVMSVVSIGLLLIYGIDAVSDLEGEGFLPIDSRTRGIVFGLSGSVLPIMSFVITRKNPSKIVGGLILSSGVLIVLGTALFLLISPQDTPDNSQLRSFGPVLGLGLAIIFFGTHHIIKTRSTK